MTTLAGCWEDAVSVRTFGVGDPALLTVVVRLELPCRRAEVIDFLATQPLLPRWQLRTVEDPEDPEDPEDLERPAGAAAGAARVAVVGAPTLRTARIPAARPRPGVVTMLEDPNEMASWSGVGCVLLATEPLGRLGRAIVEAAEGNVWLSSHAAAHLPKVLGGVRVGVGPASRPTAEARPRVALTPAEQDTLALLVQGLSNAEIAAERGVKITTVKTCVRSVLRKHGCERREELIVASLSSHARRSTHSSKSTLHP